MKYFILSFVVFGLAYSTSSQAEQFYVVQQPVVYYQAPAYSQQSNMLRAAHNAELALFNYQAQVARQRVEQEYANRVLQDVSRRLDGMQTQYYRPGLPSNVNEMVGTPATYYDERINQWNRGAVGPKGEYHVRSGERTYTEDSQSGGRRQNNSYEQQRYQRRR